LPICVAWPSGLPLIFSPTGGNRLFHHEGERSRASVAEAAALDYTLSSMSTLDIETVASCSKADKWFQKYRKNKQPIAVSLAKSDHRRPTLNFPIPL